MPTSLPTGNDLRSVDPLLTDFGMAYAQEMSSFAGDSGATIKRVPGTARGGVYPIWSKADFYRNEMAAVSNSSAAPVGGFRVTTGTYYCDAYGLKTFIADKDLSESPLDVRKQKVRYLIQQAKLKRDKLYAAAAFATGLWTSNTEQTGKSSNPSSNEFLQFNDSSSTPLKVLQDQMLVVWKATGFMPNVMVTSPDVMYCLRRHADFKSLSQYVQRGLPTYEQIAEAVGVERVLVGRSVENTAAEGQTAVMSAVFGKHILLAYVAPTAGDEQPTAVSGFAWSDYDKVDANGAAIRTWRENDPEGEWLHAEQAIVYKRTANDLGVFFKDAVA